jgi:hypothetical protein
MKRITFSLPDEMYEAIAAEARKRDVSWAEIAREALELYVPLTMDEAKERYPFIGIIDHEPEESDIVERIDAGIKSYFDQKWKEYEKDVADFIAGKEKKSEANNHDDSR